MPRNSLCLLEDKTLAPASSQSRQPFTRIGSGAPNTDYNKNYGEKCNDDHNGNDVGDGSANDGADDNNGAARSVKAREAVRNSHIEIRGRHAQIWQSLSSL